jgi:hypothetical protein
MYIAHRINTIKELKEIPIEFGVEVDLRDKGSDIILAHDPFSDGELFEDYLKEYNHRFIILNIKSERIEYRVIELLKKYNVTEYFFLDNTFPMMQKLSKEGETNIALRYSEYESIYTVTRCSGMFKWIWVDCFTKMPLDNYIFELMKTSGYKVCLVSPELHNRQDDIEDYINSIIDLGIIPDMVCSKIYNYNKWKKLI